MKQIIPKWSWEVCKMFMYMTFPVAMFHYFNSPQIFEEEVNKIKIENYPSISSEKRELVESRIREVNAERELRRLAEQKANQTVKS